jgi:signal transduction histidine kinase/CheY-like chemotaxis protein
LKNPKLYILLLEDVAEDAELALYELRRAGFEYEYLRVDNLIDFKEGLKNLLPNVIISDYSLPTCNAIDAFNLVSKYDIPFLIVSGIVGEEKAVEALKLGITDMVSKNSLTRLPIAIKRAVNEQKVNRDRIIAEHELLKNKERLELAFEGADLGAFDYDIQSNKIVYNERSLKILGENINELVHDFDYFEKFDVSNIDLVKTALEDHLNNQSEMFECEFQVSKKRKVTSWILIRGKITRQTEKGAPVRISGTILNISQRKRNEQIILKNAAIMKRAESVGHIGTFEVDFLEGSSVLSDECCKIFGVEKKDSTFSKDIFDQAAHPDDIPFLKNLFASEVNSYDIEHRLINFKTQEIVTIKSMGNIERDGKGGIMKITGLIQDITQQREVKKSVYNAQSKERKRIARDIHDGIGQMLVAAKFKLGAINGLGTPELNQNVDEIEDLMGTVIEEVRRVSRNLSNRYVEEFGIRTAINYLIEEIKGLSRFDVIDNVDIPEDYDIDLSNGLYRITQEAINNIIKYSKAKNVDIDIQKIKQNLILEISDDGIGFDTNKASNGIKNMEERTSLLNGHFEIKSVLKKGTKIKVWFPLT